MRAVSLHSGCPSQVTGIQSSWTRVRLGALGAHNPFLADPGRDSNQFPMRWIKADAVSIRLCRDPVAPRTTHRSCPGQRGLRSLEGCRIAARFGRRRSHLRRRHRLDSEPWIEGACDGSVVGVSAPAQAFLAPQVSPQLVLVCPVASPGQGWMRFARCLQGEKVQLAARLRGRC